MRFLFTTFLFLLVICLFSCENKSQKQAKRPLSPELQKALADFEIAEDFEIELFAAEPLIADPIAMEVDANGKVYVVEMHGYPLEKSGTGKVKMLIDTDSDSYPDQSTIFADSLVLPTGIMAWKNGVIVTDPPHVWYLEDSNGDNKADIKKILLTGFALSNPQHNLNNPIFGLDNWIYMAHESSITPIIYKEEFGDEGTEIYFPNRPEPRLPQNANGRNVRFKPDTYDLEMLSGESQFGQTFDEFGHHILTSNAHHLFHEVIADRYLRRNPTLLVADATQSMPDHGDACEIYPITQNPEHQLLTDVGVVTSSCGVTWYLGGLFPEKYKNMTFIAEPVHNLVHADIIENNGTSFIASRAFEKKEFLASKDAWFRPVNFYVAPDGALYVIDYYRQIVEHPEWMAEDMGKSDKLYNGTDKGRIYRVFPKNTKTLPKFEPLTKLNDKKLVELLKSPNIWYRRTAQRLLLDRKNVEAVPLLKEIIKKNESAESVVHALWTLEGLEVFEEEILKWALKNENAGVRENAIKIVEYELNKKLKAGAGVTKAYVYQLLDIDNLKNDPSPKVRYQLLCTLGFFNDEQSLQVRNELLVKDIEDKWVHYAALSAAQGTEIEVFDFAVKNLTHQPSEGKALLFANVSALIGLGDDQEKISQLMQKIMQNPAQENAWWQAASLEGLSKTLAYKYRKSENGKNTSFSNSNIFENEKKLLLSNLGIVKTTDLGKAILNLLEIIGLPDANTCDPFVSNALAVLNDKNADEGRKALAIGLLALMQPEKYMSQIQQVINPQSPIDIQKIAMQALSKTKGTTVCSFLVQEWRNFTPEVKEEAIEVFMKNRERTFFLLTALERKQIPTTAIAWHNQVRLMNNDDVSIRKKARSVLASNESNKVEILEKYKNAFDEKGNEVNGLKIYNTYCAQCHQISGKLGKNIGPDLGTLRNRQPLSIALEILLPSNSIADGYEYWAVTKQNGDRIYGIISTETATAITLKDLAGKETVIPRNEIAKLSASNTSIMPTGFEQSINPQDMNDLVSFIKSYRE
ncbi:putative membrane-bound dehydrogenase domain-containing protein [Thermoflexibacter ruber]|uniref:Putative membrane-bound dehydrogenase domain-containing protein n=1 Tax=Thermoflexibacter ruber TaxID=1003 RepID=A0A1I2G524_9BACT|nr:putative membrane-bound dehydrogenase domain-containing protein [Thermoflexibacter ruber]